MNSMTITWTAQCPSGSALPVRGHASVTVPVAAVAITGDLRPMGAFPAGTRAWRQPIC